MYKIDIHQLEELNSLVVLLDSDRKIIRFNKFAQKVTGYSADEVIGKKWLDIFISKEEKNEVESICSDNFSKSASFWHTVSNIVCKDGTKKLINWTNNLLKEDAIDEDIVVVSIGTDMSFAQELKSKDQLIIQQSKMAAMGEMLETIAHQWRQPLSVISTATSGMKMQKEYGILSNEEFYETCDHIVDIVNHLSKTIDDFRDFFKPHRDKELFNLKQTIEKTFALIDSKFKNSEIDIVYNLDDIDIHGFENELIQAFMVILNNAKDAFMAQDSSVRKLIFIDLYRKDYNAVIKIKDSAGGIPDDVIHKIFNPYFTTKQESNGTGIGLYMTEEIIAKHMKGNIHVSNSSYVYEGEDFKGAEFTIELPSLEKEKMEMKFLEELESCNCYRWNKDEEMFIKLPSCNDKMILQDISTLSEFLFEYQIKFTVLNNQNIQVHF